MIIIDRTGIYIGYIHVHITIYLAMNINHTHLTIGSADRTLLYFELFKLIV